MSVDINNRLHGIFAIGWFLDGHPPRLPVAVHSPADQRPADRNQVAGNALLLHQASQMIGGIAFANGGEIDKQIRDVFLQILPIRVVNDRQMLEPRARFRGGDLLRIRRFNRLLVWAKPPEVHQRPHRNIHGARGFCADAQREGDNISHRFADRPRIGRGGMVKAHQRRIVFPGGEQAIVGIELRLDLLSQRLGFGFINANDADPPECAHRLTIQHGRGTFWRSGGGG